VWQSKYRASHQPRQPELTQAGNMMKVMFNDHARQAACFLPKADVIMSCWLMLDTTMPYSDSRN